MMKEVYLIITYSLYDNLLPPHSSSFYLGVPIRSGGYLYFIKLINNNVNKAMAIMNQLASIGATPKGLSRILSSKFYSQTVRPQMEYGLGNSFNLKLIN